MAKHHIAAAAAGLAIVFLQAAPAAADKLAHGVPQTIVTEASAQARQPGRARTRIKVYPRTRYLPPSAKRDCIGWLEPEYRPSGTVIVPQLRCWWLVRGAN